MWIWHPHEALKGFPDTHYNWIIIYGESGILAGHIAERWRQEKGFHRFGFIFDFTAVEICILVFKSSRRTLNRISRGRSVLCFFAASISYKGIGQQPQILLDDDAGVSKMWGHENFIVQWQCGGFSMAFTVAGEYFWRVREKFHKKNWKSSYDAFTQHFWWLRLSTETKTQSFEAPSVSSRPWLSLIHRNSYGVNHRTHQHQQKFKFKWNSKQLKVDKRKTHKLVHLGTKNM